MILWMREFNQSGKGIIEFTGFDMQVLQVATQVVSTFVETADPTYLATVNSAYALAIQVYNAARSNSSQLLANYDAAVQAVTSVRQYLEAHRFDYALPGGISPRSRTGGSGTGGRSGARIVVLYEIEWWNKPPWNCRHLRHLPRPTDGCQHRLDNGTGSATYENRFVGSRLPRLTRARYDGLASG